MLLGPLTTPLEPPPDPKPFSFSQSTDSAAALAPTPTGTTLQQPTPVPKTFSFSQSTDSAVALAPTATSTTLQQPTPVPKAFSFSQSTESWMPEKRVQSQASGTNLFSFSASTNKTFADLNNRAFPSIIQKNNSQKKHRVETSTQTDVEMHSAGALAPTPTGTTLRQPTPVPKTFSFSQSPNSAVALAPTPTGTTLRQPTPVPKAFSFSQSTASWKSDKCVQSQASGTNLFSFSSSTNKTSADLNGRAFLSNIQKNNSQKKPYAEASTQTHVEIHANKLVRGLKDLLQNGNYSDINVNVKGKEFKLHKNILAANSPVFATLVDSENSVNIDEANPDIFADFLYVVYTGSTEKLNSDNVIDMYEIAKKYQVMELSALCIKHMMDHMSPKNFCDIVSLSLQHDEDKLFEVASQYFMENSIDIAESPKWLPFLKENTSVGNTLFLEALKSKKKGVASV